MNKKKSLLHRTSLIVFVILFVALACSMPGLPSIGGGPNLKPVEQTANALATSVVATQTAMVQGAAQAAEAVQTALPTGLPELTPELPEGAEVPEVPGQPTPPEGAEAPPQPPPAVAHSLIPGEPGPAKEELNDPSSAETANQKHAPKFSDKYDVNQFERPFTANNMDYRADVDITKAEITTDGTFYYVTIFLENGDPEGGVAYGAELDTDKDGRGDYLVWSFTPKVTEWTIDNVIVLTDTNNDVGAKVALHTDAPSTGNGYDNVIFSANQYRDPDTAWSRISPSNPKAIQFAFKKDFLDQQNSFLWSVWADLGLMDPARFDYNDYITLEQAGSPLEGDDYYPLKQIHTLDNTCRMGYGSALSGSEPGLCGEAETIVLPTERVPTNLPPIPNLPGQ